MDRDGRAAEASSVERQSAGDHGPAASEKTSSDKTATEPPTAAAPAFVLASFAPLPSTEMPDPSESATPPPAQGGPKKKGTALAIPKKTPKRTKHGSDSKKPKRPRAGPNARSADGASDAGESDSGPYCICRGPDDHRWMICCERCEDWFHGECVHIGKDVGEALIERFVCPNCTTDHLMTIYKKTCALQGCRKVARLTHDATAASVFCCNEHAQTWWERVLGRLPKIGSRATLSDELSQEEIMALLNSGLAGVDGTGAWRLKAPFSDADETPSAGTDGTQGPAATTNERPDYLTEEEVRHLDNMAKSRLGLAEETTLYDKMLSLIEWAQDRRRAAILAGRLAEDVCGYDQRLDGVCATRAFAAFLETPEGEAVFQAGRMDDPLGEGDEVRGMCERKRCKAHSGWGKMLVLGIRHQIREMADQADEVAKEERIMREAAGERWRRRAAEKNWVEVVE